MTNGVWTFTTLQGVVYYWKKTTKGNAGWTYVTTRDRDYDDLHNTLNEKFGTDASAFLYRLWQLDYFNDDFPNFKGGMFSFDLGVNPKNRGVDFIEIP